MRLLRQSVQLLALLLFVLLLAATTWPLRSPLSPQLFLSADPLAALALLGSLSRAWFALFWPALLLLAATALLGRFYCGWLCPLGTCLDLADRLLGPLRRRLACDRQACRAATCAPPRTGGGDHPLADGEKQPCVRLKYLLLALSLGAGLVGGHLVWLFDPVILLTRVLAIALFPGARAAYDAALPAARPLLRSLGWHWQPVEVQPLALAGLTLAAFVALLAFGLAGRRFWCRYLCPLGALLGLVGSRAPWRRRVGDACNRCGVCARRCKLGAIPAAAPQQTGATGCVRCYDCVVACPPGAARIGLGAGGERAPTDFGRRQFLGALGAGLGYGVLARAGVAFALPRLPLRPPGALRRDASGAYVRPMGEDEFLGKCLRCGQCLKACPTGGLQPATHQAGLLGLYTPVLDPRRGWCEQGCAACGAVCPSGALVPFTVEEKPHLPLGEARLDRARCLAWGQGEAYRQCLVCIEHCSYGAIGKLQAGSRERPVVDPQLCTGCAQCEHVCPAKPGPAITVSRR